MTFTMLSETIRVAVNGLLSNKLRTALTMIGITIGVAAVIVLVSLGQGLQGFVRNQFTSIGSDLVIVIASPDEDGYLEPLTMDDVEALSDNFRVPSVSMIVPQVTMTLTAVNAGTDATVSIEGVTPDYMTLRNRTVVAGRAFTQQETDTRARVALLGKTTATTLFGAASPVGQTIRLGSLRFDVIGVLNEAGSSFGMDSDDVILVPVTTAQARLSGERTLTGSWAVSVIWMKARTGDVASQALDEVRTTLRASRDLRPDDPDNFLAISQTAILDSLNLILGLLTVFLAVIAGISLLVGGIGVMNIMMVTVTERTREIGLRKAVGARSSDIVLQFLIEAVVLALLGGGLGVLIAVSMAALAQALIATLPVTVQLSTIALAVLISSAIGVFFGIYPARRAAALNPIEALRYE